MKILAYQNRSRNSGIAHYAALQGKILIWFSDGDGYEYNNSKPGRTHVDKMKKLAASGKGLTTYINQFVRDNYARKLD